MLPNQFYQQPGNYMAPPFPNFQAQQRQEQLNQVFSNSYNCYYVRERAEAENWHIAPGNHLVFEDQNGLYFYTKSLGFAPNDRPIFSVYKREDFVQQEQPKQEDSEITNMKTEMASVKNDISELKEMLKELTTKPNFNKFDKKGGGK